MRTVLLKKFSYNTFFSAFIVICSGLWMSSILPLSPFYLVLIPIFFFPLYSSYRISRTAYTTKNAYFICYSMFTYLFIHPVFTDSTLHNNFVLGFCFLFYIFCDSVLSSIGSKKSYAYIIKCFVIVTIIYMIFDFIKRYSSIDNNSIPAWIEANPLFRFYLLKGIGLHGDSNNSAVICLTVLSLLYFYRNFIAGKNKGFAFLYILLFFCLVLTCSRAAVLSFFLLVLFNHLFYQRGIYFKVFDIGLILVIFFVSLYFLSIDPSGKTKIDIYEKTWNYIWTEQDFVKLFFGYGGNNSYLILGRYGHNPISVYLIEYGIVGLSFFFSFFVFVGLDVGVFSLFILLPFFLCSLSFSPLHTTYLFAALSMVKQARRIYGIKW